MNKLKTYDELISTILLFLKNAAPQATTTLNAHSRILEIIDSFALVEMIEYLESEMDIRADLAEAEPKDLSTAADFAAFLIRNR